MGHQIPRFDDADEIKRRREVCKQRYWLVPLSNVNRTNRSGQALAQDAAVVIGILRAILRNARRTICVTLRLVMVTTTNRLAARNVTNSRAGRRMTFDRRLLSSDRYMEPAWNVPQKHNAGQKNR